MSSITVISRLITGAVLGVVVCSSALAQPVSSPASMGMGGAGTAYLKGVESIFYNPANTFPGDSTHSLHIKLGSAGADFIPLQSQSHLQKQWQHYREYLDIYKGNRSQLSDFEQMEFISSQYEEDETRATYNSNLDLTPIAVTFRSDDFALSLAFRTRILNRFEIGRGWYSSEVINTGEGNWILDRTLSQKLQTFHEVSLSYAQPLTYLDGLTPSLGRFYIGITPKFLFGGTFMDATYGSSYQSIDDGPVHQIRSFRYQSSGSYSRLARDIRQGTRTLPAIRSTLDNESLAASSGYGLGVDFGLTYIQPIGSNIDTRNGGVKKITPRNKSFAVSFSVTDLGYYYHKNIPILQKISPDTTRTSFPSSIPVAAEIFSGSPGQYHYFLEQFSQGSNPFQEGKVNSSSIMQLLPGSIQAGVLLNYNQFTFTGDFHSIISESIFHDKGLRLHAGFEYRPFPVWPIRAGFQLQSNDQSFLTVGSGIEMDRWSFSAAMKFSGPNHQVKTDLYGIAVTSLILHL